MASVSHTANTVVFNLYKYMHLSMSMKYMYSQAKNSIRAILINY